MKEQTNAGVAPVNNCCMLSIASKNVCSRHVNDCLTKEKSVHYVNFGIRLHKLKAYVSS